MLKIIAAFIKKQTYNREFRNRIIESIMQEMYRYKVGSLFAGIGGIDLAFLQVGCKIEWANEIDANACKSYERNFDHKIICKDIKNLTSEELVPIDILTGGFPCQAFSIAGHRKGFADERGTVVFELLRIVKSILPRVVFLENVKNLKSHNKGETFKSILQKITDFGYSNKYAVLNSCEYSNIPQNRERLYIVCFRDKKDYEHFIFPQKSRKLLSVRDLLDNKVMDKYYYNNSKYYPILKESMTNSNTCYQWRRHYVRENKSNLCPTLTANMGTGGHNVPLIFDKKGVRKLTPRECARFQGFPDSFKLNTNFADSVLYKQFGNSVSVPVIKLVAENILQALNG